MTQTGHYLPNFIDWMENFGKVPPALRGTYRETISHMKRANSNGVRFALQDNLRGVVPDRHPFTGADLRPPYPTTIIEYDDIDSDQNVIVVEDLGSHVKLRAYASLGHFGVAVCPFEIRLEYVDHWLPIEMRCWSWALVDRTAEKREMTRDELIKSATELLDASLSMYARLCAVLVNNHVETTDVPPDAKENRIRRIKGKAPLYTYKTLIIGAAKAHHVGKGGGTHASPRSHLRRGFYRTSKTGVRHWVKATIVKGETPGFVHKDYQINQGNNT
jgi:hypothetical protein